VTPDSTEGAAASARRFISTHVFATGLALFAAASLVRLALILTGRWTGDEIGEWQTAGDILRGKDFPLLGPVISGGLARMPGPLIYWVGALPLLVSPSRAPEACNAFVALLGGASVWLFWRAIRPYFTETGALFAAFMMACAPWSTLYADRLWNPNVVGLFVALAFWAACRAREEPRLGHVVTLIVSMAAALQLHMSAPMFWVALVPIWLPGVRKWRWYWPVIGTALGALLYAPMLVHELRTHWSNTLAFLHEASSTSSNDYLRVPLWAFRLLTLDISYLQLKGYWYPQTEGAMVGFLVHGSDPLGHACTYQCNGHDADFHYTLGRKLLLVISILFAVVALVVAGARAWVAGRKEPHPFMWAALAGLVANTALLGLAHKELHGHYVQLLLPFYFVAFASLADWAAARAATWWGVVGTAAIVCLGGVDAALWESRTLDGRNGLGTARQVIALVREDAPGATRAAINVGYRSLSAERLNYLTALDPQHPLHFDQGDQYRLLLNDASPPRGGRVLGVVGPVTLYRTR
jgi:hypothetical protein